MRDTVELLQDEIRTMQEEQRGRDISVEGARKALADQTESRRQKLADETQSGMTQRQKISFVLGIIGTLIAIIGVLFTHPWSG